MEDYRLEQQKNTAAELLLRAPLLNLYAYKQSLAPAVARFRLLQVISQNPDEADPTPLGGQHSSGPLNAQVPGVNQPHPEPQQVQQRAVAEPQQGPRPLHPVPNAVDEDHDLPHLTDTGTDSTSDSDSDWPSDLDADDDFEAGRQGRRAGAVGVGRNPHPHQAQHQQVQQQQPLRHQAVGGDEPRGQRGWAAANEEPLPDAE